MTLDFTKYDGEQCWFEIRPVRATEDAHGLQNNSIEFNFRNATRASGPVSSLALSRLMILYDFNLPASKATFGLSSTTTPSTTSPSTTSPSTTTSSATLSTSTSISANTSTEGSTESSFPQTSSPTHSGLSTAAVAGIGVAGGIVGIVIATIIGVLVMRWRKKKRSRAGDLSDKTRRHYEQSPSTLAGSIAHEMAAPNAEGNDKYSLVPSLRPQEMDAQQTQRYEAA